MVKWIAVGFVGGVAATLGFFWWVASDALDSQWGEH